MSDTRDLLGSFKPNLSPQKVSDTTDTTEVWHYGGTQGGAASCRAVTGPRGLHPALIASASQIRENSAFQTKPSNQHKREGRTGILQSGEKLPDRLLRRNPLRRPPEDL